MPYWFPSNSYTELATNDVLNNVLNKYQEAASSWANTIQGYAEYFFSALAVMDLFGNYLRHGFIDHHSLRLSEKLYAI